MLRVPASVRVVRRQFLHSCQVLRAVLCFGLGIQSVIGGLERGGGIGRDLRAMKGRVHGDDLVGGLEVGWVREGAISRQREGLLSSFYSFWLYSLRLSPPPFPYLDSPPLHFEAQGRGKGLGGCGSGGKRNQKKESGHIIIRKTIRKTARPAQSILACLTYVPCLEAAYALMQGAP